VETPSSNLQPPPRIRSAAKQHGDQLLSWWLAAAIVGADIGTSVFYSTGVIWPMVGYFAPVIIAIVCGLMWFFKSTYQEGCSASPFNGGAYMMVLQTVGRRTAMIVGALTILSYLATAAVSALSGAYYIDSFDNIMNWPVHSIVAVAIIPVVLFGLLNIIGIKEPAMIVFFIATFHFLLLLGMDFYGGYLLATTPGIDITKVFRGAVNVPAPNLLHGFAAAFLGITGFESAAQIVEQLKTPTWRTLQRVYLSIVILVGITAPVTSYLCLTLLTEPQIVQFKDSLLSGLAYREGGTPLQIVLVCDAALVLFAAVNTAYVGCIGLVTTMAKQGNMPSGLLRRWADKFPLFQGYPYVVLSFMVVSTLMILVLPGQVTVLGEVYGMAFLAVMISFAAGVVLMRVRMPLKIARSPFRSRWMLHLGPMALPVPAIVSIAALGFAEVIIILSSPDARNLGLQIFLMILLVMCFYRLGVIEDRLTELPDLRIGMGRYANANLPEPDELPTYVVCTGGAKARNLATMIIKLLDREETGAKEIIIFHAEEESTRRGLMQELLQRVVTQQLATSFKDKDLVISVKVLPESLVDGLIALKRAHPFKRVFIGTGTDPAQAHAYARDLETNLGIHVVNVGQFNAHTGDYNLPDTGNPATAGNTAAAEQQIRRSTD
jgi:amino acid transporter